MSVSEKRKDQTRKWDKENMCALSCRVRSYEAEIFKEYCTANDTTPYRILKNYVLSCNDEYTRSKK